MKTPVSTSADDQASATQVARRIAVGITGYSEGPMPRHSRLRSRGATGATMMLVAVDPNPMIVVPEGLDWKSLHQQARNTRWNRGTRL